METRAIIVYSVLRVAVFAIPFALLMLLPIFRDLWWLAAIFAAVIGFSLSVLVLRRPLERASAALYDKRMRRAPAASSVREQDADAEDAVLADERPRHGGGVDE